MNYHEYIGHCAHFMELCIPGNEKWELVRLAENTYLRLMKVQKMTISAKKCLPAGNSRSDSDSVGTDPSNKNETAYVELCSVEYHVIFNESYAVPVLLFNIYREDGERLNMEEAWVALGFSTILGSSKQYETLTMVEHPLLFRPFLCLHPCKTLDLLDGLPASDNPILTFLSTYGPFVRLYGTDLPTYVRPYDHLDCNSGTFGKEHSDHCQPCVETKPYIQRKEKCAQK